MGGGVGGLKKGFNYKLCSDFCPRPPGPRRRFEHPGPTLLGTPTPPPLSCSKFTHLLECQAIRWTTHRSVMASKARQIASTVTEVSIARLLQPPLPVLLLSALVLLSLSIFSLFTPRAARSPPQQPSCLANIDTTVVCGNPRHRAPSLLTIGSLLRYVSNFLSSLTHQAATPLSATLHGYTTAR